MSERVHWGEVTTEDFPRTTAVIGPGVRLTIDGVECVITAVADGGITTRPVTDAD